MCYFTCFSNLSKIILHLIAAQDLVKESEILQILIVIAIVICLKMALRMENLILKMNAVMMLKN